MYIVLYQSTVKHKSLPIHNTVVAMNGQMLVWMPRVMSFSFAAILTAQFPLVTFYDTLGMEWVSHNVLLILYIVIIVYD